MALRPGPVNANAARAHLRLAREAPAEAVRALARMARDSPLGEGRPANHLAGGVLRPKEQVERAEAVNASHAGACLRAAAENEEDPRRVQRRSPGPKLLYRRRQDRDRARRNSCLVMEGVRRTEAHKAVSRAVTTRHKTWPASSRRDLLGFTTARAG